MNGMIDLLLASALACADSKELVQNIMESGQSTIDKHELIEVIKTNTEVGCYEGSEHDTRARNSRSEMESWIGSFYRISSKT